MRKCLLLYISWICMIAMTFAYPSEANPDETNLCLVVWQKDGSKVVFDLKEKPKITYEEEKVVITSSSIVEYDFRSIMKMTYETESAVGIDAVTINKEKSFTSNGETISFHPTDQDLSVKVVAMNGMLIKDFVVKQGSSASLALNSFSTNIYMIIVNGVTYKIMVK